MSKKKRNRRPASSPARPGGVAAPVEVMQDDGIEAAAPDEADAGATAALSSHGDAVTPLVDAALAQAVAMAQVDADDDAPAPRLDATPAMGVVPTWTAQESGDIRGVLIQVAGGRLLLPNATIAEVLSYAEPESGGEGVDWLLGRFRWRGWQIPLIAFSRLAGIGEDKPGLGTKVIVLKALGGDRRIPFFAIVTQGFPRLVTVSRGALGIESQDGPLPPGVQAFVRLNDEPALLPDLAQIEQHLRDIREAA